MRIIALLFATMLITTPLLAYNALETRDEASDRHASERYESRQSHGDMAPLGGYSEKLGDSYGSRRRGY